MSKPTSPWSMIGRLVGSSRSRSSSRKREESTGGNTKLKQDEAKEHHDIGEAQVVKMEQPARVAEMIPEVQHMLNVGNPLASHQDAHTDISIPTTSNDEERGWTQVIEPLVVSTATGTEHQREDGEAESTFDQKVQDGHSGEQQAVEPRKEVRAFEDDNVEMVKSADIMKQEEHQVLTRIRLLEDELMNRSDTIRYMESTLETAGREKRETLERLHDAENRARELDDRNTFLLQKDEERENEMRQIQENNILTTMKLNTTLIELETAIRQSEAVQDQNRQLTEERRDKEKALKDLEADSCKSLHDPNQIRLEVLQHQNRMLTDQIRRQSEQSCHPLISQLRQISRGWERSIQEYNGIVGPLDRLNSEIFQTAAYVVESLDFGGRNSWATLEKRGVVERATLTVGQPMILAIQNFSAKNILDVNPLVIQIALQICMARSCAKIIASWYPGHWEYGNFLEAIYARIRRTDCMYAAKWRTITQAQLKRASDECVQSEMKAFLLDDLVDVLVVTGWEEVPSSTEPKLAKLQARLELIVKLALGLNMNMSMADEWETSVVQPKDLFDPETMDKAYEGDEKTQGDDLVVGTTDIGLKKASRGIVLKPKVAVQWMVRGNHVRFVRVQ